MTFQGKKLKLLFYCSILRASTTEKYAASRAWWEQHPYSHAKEEMDTSLAKKCALFPKLTFTVRARLNNHLYRNMISLIAVCVCVFLKLLKPSNTTTTASHKKRKKKNAKPVMMMNLILHVFPRPRFLDRIWTFCIALKHPDTSPTAAVSWFSSLYNQSHWQHSVSFKRKRGMYIFWTERLLLKPAYLDLTQLINTIIYAEWTKPTDMQIPKKPKGKKKCRN